jgi:predicted 3-demethylubiquinone-9 3-methyltransferase (glyoxalase superfamily)
MTVQPISICLWFETEAEEAAKFYTSIFKNSEIKNISRFSSEGKDTHQMSEGTVMTASFSLNNMDFLALNGRRGQPFTEATSIIVTCENQEEINHYWNSLTKEGEESMCGWLKDKYGVSWQIIPSTLGELLKSENAMSKLMQMKKIVIDELK